MEAAVMPLPSELVTPPVTKTYFGIGLPYAPRGGWSGRRDGRRAAREQHRLVPLGKRSYRTAACWV
jgi:hypothetical protein